MVCFVLIFVYQMIADFGAEGFASCASDGLIILWKVYGYRHSHISKGVRLTYPGAHCVFSGACIIISGADLAWFVRGAGGFSEGVHYSGGPGAFSPRKVLKFEALKCHFLHSEHYMFIRWICPHSTCTSGKSAMLYGDPPYWCLNVFSRIRKSIISM